MSNRVAVSMRGAVLAQLVPTAQGIDQTAEHEAVDDPAHLAGTLQGIAAAAIRARRGSRIALRSRCRYPECRKRLHHRDRPEFRAVLERAAGRGAARMPIWRLHLAQSDPLLAVEDVRQDPAISPELAARLGSGAFLGVRLEHVSVKRAGAPALLGTLFCSYTHPRRFSAGRRGRPRTRGPGHTRPRQRSLAGRDGHEPRRRLRSLRGHPARA